MVFRVKIAVLCCLVFMMDTEKFKAQQLKYPRVRSAYKDKDQFIVDKLKGVGIVKEKLELYIQIFKKEKILEVWAKNVDDKQFKPLINYPFCATSGKLGPKRKSGDLQIPEGIYYVDRFNPSSNFHLSLGINYPNQADRILGYQQSLGGDIFLHGGCVTIGCVPITDDKIKELYILAVEAKNRGQQQIKVHIYPTKLTDKGLNWLLETKATRFHSQWKALRPIYDYFERYKKLPQVKIKQNGTYYIPA